MQISEMLQEVQPRKQKKLLHIWNCLGQNNLYEKIIIFVSFDIIINQNIKFKKERESKDLLNSNSMGAYTSFCANSGNSIGASVCLSWKKRNKFILFVTNERRF